MPVGLERRFLDFLIGLPGAECLDSADIEFPQGIRRADFLLDERRVIAEVKTLSSDPAYKIRDRVDRHLRETGKRIFGTVWTDRLFRSREESARFHHEAWLALTKNIEGICRSANHQIRETRELFGLHSAGLLVILNESVDVLDPNVVAGRVFDFLVKEPRDIHFCLLIFESHQVRDSGEMRDQLHLLEFDFRNEGGDACIYISNLMRQWVESNGGEYIEKTISEPSMIEYSPRKK